MEMRNRKREALLKAGLKLFVENGFHATPTSQISKVAGVATGTLFNHFKTKEELINGIYLYAKDEMVKNVMSGIDEDDTIRSSSFRIWRKYIEWGVENPFMIRFFMMFTNSPYILGITREEALKGYQTAIDMMIKGQKMEIISDLDLELLCGILVSSMNTAVMYLVEHPDKAESEEFIQQTLNLLWNIVKL